jgi:hypothetical protein
MKREELFVTVAIAAGVALASPVVSANGVNSPEQRAWAAAQQGPDQLRHFVDRTRAIYGLNYSDYFKPGDNVPESDIAAEPDGYAVPSEGAEVPLGDAPSAKRQKELDQDREQLNRDMQHD